MSKYSILALALMVLSGCANWESTKDRLISEAAAVNDAEAELVGRLGCTMDLAAWGRLKDIRPQDGYFYACVPEAVAKRYGVELRAPLP